jgi:hypothetical protein
MSIYALDRGLMPGGALMARVRSHMYDRRRATVSYLGLIVILLAILVAWRARVVRDIGVGANG